MSGILTGDYPEPTFNFTTSEGEKFTMTVFEVADAMAFVRELKAKADKEAARHTCPHCGGECDGDFYRLPTRARCKSCKKFWTP